MTFRLVIRADASLTIGTGHVMRCLTLAQALHDIGWQVRFVARDLKGNQNARISASGFDLSVLPSPGGHDLVEPGSTHAHWAEVSWMQDATETKAVVDAADADWLVVDHYAFDARWEEAACLPHVKLMVIDDLADRPHDCDLLLDQNLGRLQGDYDELVPSRCERLIGPSYALLRPEFAKARDRSLQHRKSGVLEHIVVSMGGIDLPNATSLVLNALQQVLLPSNVQVTVVMGGQAPALKAIRAQAQRMPFYCKVVVDVADMASLFASADLAIGGAGVTAWERCVLGVPSLVVVIADNQNEAAKALDEVGAAMNLGNIGEEKEINGNLQKALLRIVQPGLLHRMISASFSISDGNGTSLVARAIQAPR